MKAFLILLMLLSPAYATDRAEWNPPAQYDHKFDGTIFLVRVPPERVGSMCKNLFELYDFNIKTSSKQRGCAVYIGRVCYVITIDRPKYGTTPEAVFRHEQGHCNGWPANHPED